MTASICSPFWRACWCVGGAGRTFPGLDGQRAHADGPGAARPRRFPPHRTAARRGPPPAPVPQVRAPAQRLSAAAARAHAFFTAPRSLADSPAPLTAPAATRLEGVLGGPLLAALTSDGLAAVEVVLPPSGRCLEAVLESLAVLEPRDLAMRVVLAADTRDVEEPDELPAPTTAALLERALLEAVTVVPDPDVPSPLFVRTELDLWQGAVGGTMEGSHVLRHQYLLPNLARAEEVGAYRALGRLLAHALVQPLAVPAVLPPFVYRWLLGAPGAVPTLALDDLAVVDLAASQKLRLRLTTADVPNEVRGCGCRTVEGGGGKGEGGGGGRRAADPDANGPRAARACCELASRATGTLQAAELEAALVTPYLDQLNALQVGGHSAPGGRGRGGEGDHERAFRTVADGRAGGRGAAGRVVLATAWRAARLCGSGGRAWAPARAARGV